jgi:hypothetical protein
MGNRESYDYVLVQWPKSQIFMDFDWFDDEAILADCDKFGSAAYFIPKNRLDELNDK